MLRLFLIGALLFWATGCSLKPPTIAHVHIGHSITSWRDTPSKEGLLVTAERDAEKVVTAAKGAEQNCLDLGQAREATNEVVALIDPPVPYAGKPGQSYGLRRAVVGSINHLAFAAESDDASTNVRLSVPTITDRAGGIVERIDEILFLSPAIESARSSEETCAITAEIRGLSESVVDGSATQQYGLAQMRQDVVSMIDEESPAYTTVDTWYLLNIVRLPSGKWGFVQTQDDVGGGGGGGGGY